MEEETCTLQVGILFSVLTVHVFTLWWKRTPVLQIFTMSDGPALVKSALQVEEVASPVAKHSQKQSAERAR